MQWLLIANPPPGQYYTGMIVGLLVAAAAIVWLFFRRSQVRGWSVLLIALGMLLAAPAIAMSMLGIAILCVSIHPVDRLFYLRSIGVISSVAGVLLAMLVAVIGSLRMATQRPDDDQDA